MSTLTGDASNVSGDASNVSGDAPNVFGDASNVSGDAPNVFGDASNVFGDAPNVFGDASHLMLQRCSSDVPARASTGIPASLSGAGANLPRGPGGSGVAGRGETVKQT